MAALLEVLARASKPLLGPAAQDGGGEGVRAGEESARLRCALADAAGLPTGGAGAEDGADAVVTADRAVPDRAASAPSADPGLGEVIGRCGAAFGLVVEAVGAGDGDAARGAIATALTRLREVLHHTDPASPARAPSTPTVALRGQVWGPGIRAAPTAAGRRAGAGPSVTSRSLP